jgi:hypothetical protein
VTGGRAVVAALALTLTGASAASAWLSSGHRRVAADAVRLLPPLMPAFFRAHPDEVGDAAVDPDYWKTNATPALRDGEEPNHFLDEELLDGAALPALRSSYLELLARRHLAVSRVGLLPYAIVEGFERLTLCFAEARSRPGDPGVEAKCRVDAGRLGHYAADLEQPLHTTVDYRGWLARPQASATEGTHYRVDGLFISAAFDASTALAGLRPETIAEPWQRVLAELAASHALLGRVRALEAQLPRIDERSSDPEIVAFAAERYRSTAGFLASLYWSAWQRSATIEVPAWARP